MSQKISVQRLTNIVYNDDFMIGLEEISGDDHPNCNKGGLHVQGCKREGESACEHQMNGKAL